MHVPEILESVFWSNRDFVDVPEILESVFTDHEGFWGRSRNSGIGVYGQLEILGSFQIFWNR